MPFIIDTRPKANNRLATTGIAVALVYSVCTILCSSALGFIRMHPNGRSNRVESGLEKCHSTAKQSYQGVAGISPSLSLSPPPSPPLSLSPHPPVLVLSEWNGGIKSPPIRTCVVICWGSRVNQFHLLDCFAVKWVKRASSTHSQRRGNGYLL